MLNARTSEWLKRTLLGRSAGASGSWGEEKPSILELVKNAGLDKAGKKKNTADEAAKKLVAANEKTNSANGVTQSNQAALVAATGAPEMSKINAVTDRYASIYNDSVKALSKFNDKAFGKDGNTGVGDSDSMAAYNSPQRGHLMMQQRQAFRLLKDGSFADKSNIKKEARQLASARAEESLANVTYKQNLGNAYVANANTNIAAEQRKSHESTVAENYLNGTTNGKKKKKIDLNEINALFE